MSTFATSNVRAGPPARYPMLPGSERTRVRGSRLGRGSSDHVRQVRQECTRYMAAIRCMLDTPGSLLGLVSTSTKPSTNWPRFRRTEPDLPGPRGSSEREFGGASVTGRAIDLDTDLCGLAAGGSFG